MMKDETQDTQQANLLQQDDQTAPTSQPNSASQPTSPADSAEPEVPVGLLTWEAEGQEGGPYHSRRLHVPSSISGLTIGRGYDMKFKGDTKIYDDLTRSGVSDDMATLLAKAGGLSGEAAKAFITANNLADFEISKEAQRQLFLLSYGEMVADVQRICNKKDCVAIYGAVDWSELRSEIKEVLVDLRYRGDYTSQSRKLIQKFVADNNLAEFSRALSTRQLWQQVPQDRFDRRVACLRGSGD